jgi:transcriptional regulator with XRE-family HTH domain
MEFKNQQIMKQPELGKKILELRKQKGFTQEELVDQCNINVRTIQRIEAGDVSPRSYTIKAILEVLGFNYEEIFEEKYTAGKFDAILGIKENAILKQLNLAFVFGIGFFVFGSLEILVEFLDFKDDWLFKVIYTLVKSLSFISLLFFFRGFIIVGNIYKNYLLQISAFLIIVFTLFLSSLDVFSLFLSDDFVGIISLSKLISYGIVSILFGVALLRLKEFGGLAYWTGIIEIITGACLLLVILSPIALVTQTVVEILEIILIYRITLKLKGKL